MMLPSRLSVIALVAAASAGCQPEPADISRPSGRQVAESTWDTVFVRGGTVDDTIIGTPSYLDSDGTNLYAFDWTNQRLVAIGPGGAHLWTVGRRGHGPGEFQNVRGIAVTRDRTVVLLDPENLRLTVIRSQGEIDTMIPARGMGHPEAVMGLTSDKYLLYSVAREPFSELTADGEVVAKYPFPWHGYQDLHPMAAQGSMAWDPDSDRWAYAFIWGDRWFGFDGVERPRVSGLYVDSVPWPSIEVHTSGPATQSMFAEPPVWAIRGVALDGDVVYLLSAPSSPDSRQYLDRYDWNSGTYLDSWELPQHARRFVVRGGIIYLATDEFFPGILALKRLGR